MPETADRTESLFAAAVALPPEERGAYLERECSGDPALRRFGVALFWTSPRNGPRSIARGSLPRERQRTQDDLPPRHDPARDRGQ